MLHLHRHQIEIFAERARADFVRDAVTALEGRPGMPTATEIERFVRDNLPLAEKAGMRSRADALRWMEVALLHGADFASRLDVLDIVRDPVLSSPWDRALGILAAVKGD